MILIYVKNQHNKEIKMKKRLIKIYQIKKIIIH
jgi:hypothetical protein